MKNRVVVVEDHQLLRQGLCLMVGSLPDFEIVGEARDGKEAVRSAVTLVPDLMLMDLSMPNMNGIEATTLIKRRLPQVRVIALTAYTTDEYVREALRAGADGYVVKDTSYEELAIALRSVMAGKKFLSPEVSTKVVSTYLHPHETPRSRTPWDKLTVRERNILKLIAEGRTNRAAAEFLNVSPKTVEKHRASLMRKLGLRTVTELTLAALESGLIERPRSVTCLFDDGNCCPNAPCSSPARVRPNVPDADERRSAPGPGIEGQAAAGRIDALADGLEADAVAGGLPMGELAGVEADAVVFDRKLQ
jgi:DNA-binding NarL/FixJ family response regulator